MAQHQPIRKATPPTGSDIPDKLYFRIGEVARLCDVPAYVLRFWESEFPQLKPHKGGTGQRLYRRRDVEMALRLRTSSTTRATQSPAHARSSKPSSGTKNRNSHSLLTTHPRTPTRAIFENFRRTFATFTLSSRSLPPVRPSIPYVHRAARALLAAPQRSSSIYRPCLRKIPDEI